MHHTLASPSLLFASRRRRARFLVGLCLAFLGSVEVGARLYILLRGHRGDEVRQAFAWRQKQRLTGSWPAQDRDYPYLPYLPRAFPPDVDLRGLRLVSADRIKLPDVFRVFCLGGSTTYLGYPAKLQKGLADDFAARGLRLEVVNAADIAWTSVETFIHFTVRCLHYQPDAVIALEGVNDAVAVFGETFRPDYSHWRKRLVANGPLLWDRLPRWLDHSTAFVQVRAWLEGRQQQLTWATSMMHYVPDYAHDPYHGTDSFRHNITNLLTVAKARGLPVLLCTSVTNDEVPEQRLVAAIKDMNEVTRSLADPEHNVFVVDASAAIQGTYRNMYDVCHFRPGLEGELALVRVIADAVRAHLDDWIQRDAPLAQVAHGPISLPDDCPMETGPVN